MGHSRAQKAKTHERIIKLASKRFREEGLGPEESYFVSRSRDITPLTRAFAIVLSYLTSRIAVTNARQSHPDSWRMTLVLFRCDLKVAEMIVCRKDEFIRRAVPSALPYEAWREGNDSSWNPPTTYPAIERSASEPRGDGAAASIKVARGQG
jgi:hypothetical protein